MFPIRDHHPSHKLPVLTVALIALNVFVFVVQLMATDLDTLINSYALIPQSINIFYPQTWLPFLTSMFMHGGFLHILSNMWFLWIFGDNVEATLGHIKFLLFYLLAGLGASLLQYIIDPSSTIPMLGASGAIAGVLGGYLVLFPHAKVETLIVGFFGHFQRVNLPAQVMLVYWFVTQLFSGVGSIAAGVHNSGGVAFFAHIGGFVVGYILVKRLVKPSLDWVRIE